MIAVDTSVVVAAFATWHEGHAAARAALLQDTRLPAHVAVETYSVLTRLPPPHRAEATLVEAFLRQRFPGPVLVLPEQAYQRLLKEASRSGIAGGAVYDALIGLTAAAADLPLLTRDRRAVRTYELMGAQVELLA